MLGLMNLMEKQVNKSDFYSSFDATILVASFFCFFKGFFCVGGVLPIAYCESKIFYTINVFFLCFYIMDGEFVN